MHGTPTRPPTPTRKQTDWTVSNQSLVTFDKNAVVYEDQVRAFYLSIYLSIYLSRTDGEPARFLIVCD